MIETWCQHNCWRDIALCGRNSGLPQPIKCRLISFRDRHWIKIFTTSLQSVCTDGLFSFPQLCGYCNALFAKADTGALKIEASTFQFEETFSLLAVKSAEGGGWGFFPKFVMSTEVKINTFVMVFWNCPVLCASIWTLAAVRSRK